MEKFNNSHLLVFLGDEYKYNMQSRDRLSAKAWILMDYKNSVYIRGFNTQEKRQIASVTKMYTLYTCFVLNKQLKINPETTYVKIFDSGLSGTLANLLPNQYISVIDLYYGMMLPSGNDAAYVLACYYGSWIIANKNPIGVFKTCRKENLGEKIKYCQLYCKKFVQFMNNYIVKEELNHVHTHFQNPHGLSDKAQYSNVWELAEASLKFHKNQLFAKICGNVFHRGFYYQSDQCFQWSNTNILLNEGYRGIKTGYTTTAGGCLSSITSIRLNKFQEQELLIVLLGSNDSITRFEDSRIIVKDYQNYLKMMAF